MSSQRRFEGPVLEDLLEQVRSESGGDARIVAANRVRRGGLGGFFAREHYEVVVEISDDAPSSAPRGRTATATRPTRAPRRRRVDVETPATPAPPVLSAAVGSVLDLVDATNDQERRRNVVDLARAERGVNGDDHEPRVSTQTDGFQEILERLAGGLDADAAAARSHTQPDDDAPARRARDEIEVVDEVTVVHDAVEARGTRQAHDAREAVVVPDIREAIAVPDIREAIAVPDIREAIVVPDVAPPREQTTAAPRTVATAAPQSAARARRGANEIEVLDRPENALARLGVPPRFVPRGIHGVALRGALIESLAALPAPDPMPDAQGVVIAIVGIGSRPIVLARALAEEQGFDPDNVVVAAATELGDGVPSWLQICDPETADERRRSWRRREHATFVAVSITGLGHSTDWARGMLDGLEPTQVWAITNAATKPEDIETWAERLGGVDVLALERLEDTTSPAAILRLSMPVGRLDGAPATPLRWADLLLERMAWS